MKALLAFVLLAAPAAAGQRLLLVGGGPRPPEALALFGVWAGGPKARILVIAWGKEESSGTLAAVRADFAPLSPAAVEAAPQPPLSAESRAAFLAQLSQATAVFFGGGDQSRIMDVLADAPLAEALRGRYRAGIPFGGTSAGTAIMSPVMITGEGEPESLDAARYGTRGGLGLLPGAILDQHFLKRQRANRLLALILAGKSELGLGIDEGAALAVEDGRRARVFGGSVLAVVRERDGRLILDALAPGSAYDVNKRRRL
ncbi:MAG: cyanophycinase [Elusimicrobia bacterium]|nr:cyanophycinase [Elusimicrobiota bacterium]